MLDGTSMVAELIPLVTVAIPPEVESVWFACAGRVTVFPPLILKLFPIRLKVGFGTFMVKLFRLTVPALTIPVPVIVGLD